MSNLIGMYLAHRNLLLEHQENVIKELDFIKQKDLDKDTRNFMAELMTTVTDLNTDINLLDIEIEKLKKKFNS